MMVMKQGEANKKDTELRDYIMRLFFEMAKEKQEKEYTWKEVTDYIYPRRSGWDYSSDRDLKVGEKIFDGVGVACLNKLAEGIFGWMCSPSIDWIALRPKDRRHEQNHLVMKYARDLEMYLYGVFARSNFYDALAEDITDCSALGTSVLFVDDDDDNDKPVLMPIHIREFYISENQYNNVDTMVRELEMTNRQVLEKFNKASDVITEEYQKTAKRYPENRVKIIHAMYPQGQDGVFKHSQKYSSIYIMLGPSSSGSNARTSNSNGQWVIRKGKMKYQRFLAWRFEKVPGSTYGWCPSFDALSDVKMQNIQAKTMADVAQLAARPPMQGEESLRGRVKIAPGAFIWHNGQKVEPLQTSFNYPIGIDAMQRREMIIREHFKTDFFMSISNMQGSSRERTREEILQLKAESAAVLGTIVGRVISERLDPLVKLILQIEVDKKRAPVPPDGIPPDVVYDFEFVGPLAMAQKKYVRLQGINQGVGAMQGLMQMFGPDISFVIDKNWTAKEVITANGFPYEGLVEPKQVEQAQAQAAQAREQARQEELQLKRDEIMAKANKTPEQGSPLAREMQAGAPQDLSVRRR